MVEVVLLWALIDCITIAIMAHVTDYLSEVNGRALITQQLMTAQLIAAVWWLLAGCGRWSERTLFLAIVFCMLALVMREVVGLLTNQHSYAGQLYAAWMVELILHGPSDYASLRRWPCAAPRRSLQLMSRFERTPRE